MWYYPDGRRSDAFGGVLLPDQPFNSADLLLLVERALEEKYLRTEIQRLQREVEGHYHFDRIIAKSQAMQHVLALVDRLKDHHVNVLLTGESGTGKDLIARTLHYHSDRKHAPFVPVNCGGVPEPLLESELFGYRRGAFTDARTDKPDSLLRPITAPSFSMRFANFPCRYRRSSSASSKKRAVRSPWARPAARR